MENTNNTYEELVQLKESGEIGWREFIRRQPEMEDGYYHWKRPRHERRNGRGVYHPHRGTRTGIGAALQVNIITK